MGPIWKGMVSFGLVNVSVNLFSATRKKTINFNQLRKSDGSRINHKKVAVRDGREVPNEEIVKGYEINKNQYIVITDNDLASIAPKASHVIEITDFVRAEQIDPRHYDSSYYLVPAEGAGKAYALLLKSMQEENVVGIARFVLRSKEYLVAIRPIDGAFVLSTMLFADEIIPATEFSHIPLMELTEKEMNMAKTLIQSLITDFKPELYENQYNNQVLELINRKAAEQMIMAPAQQITDKVVDLITALEASIKLARTEKEKIGRLKRTKKDKPA